MVFTIVPTNQLVVLLDKREETVLLLLIVLTAAHLSQQPRTGDDSMSLQQFETCRSLHLAGDNRSQVLFDWQLVDSRYLVGLHH